MPSFFDFFHRLRLSPALYAGRQPAASLPVEHHLTTSQYAGSENDNTFYPGQNMSGMYRDRYDYDRQFIFSECLRAWRINPLARRIVKLISMFIVGDGIEVKSDNKHTDKFLQEWWKHPLNHLDRKCVNFCDEATRSGNLFFLCTADQSTGMVYIRAVPADQIDEIITSENDIEQELVYKSKINNQQSQISWPGYDRSNQQSVFMLHYAYNQPVGVPWGEPDLAPMLPWLGRYASWLEERARLNRFRQAFMYVVTGKFADRAARDARQIEINANPPQPGSVLVADDSETWTVLAPQLASHDANEDGLSLKKILATGAGIPIHYLAEPESATRTTAEASDNPTFRGLEQTQTFFLQIIQELAQIAVNYRHQYDHLVLPGSRIEAIGPDMTEKDNANLALAVSRIYPAVSEIFDRGGIDENELLRLVYRMAGETQPQTARHPTMQKKPMKATSPAQSSNRTNAGSGNNAGDAGAGL
jgi:hypothetical protein